MSKAEVLNVATLAVHLALRYGDGYGDKGAEIATAPLRKEISHRFVGDAFKLQKLGARWRRMELKKDQARGKGADWDDIPKEAQQAYNAEASRVGLLVRDLLRPYGLARVHLGGHWSESCICILDLPTNMPDKTGDGFYI